MNAFWWGAESEAIIHTGRCNRILVLKIPARLIVSVERDRMWPGRLVPNLDTKPYRDTSAYWGHYAFPPSHELFLNTGAVPNRWGTFTYSAHSQNVHQASALNRL